MGAEHLKKETNEQNVSSFEESLAKLEYIVDQLETGDVALETAIQLFQEGMLLSKACHGTLQKVEQQIKILLEEDGELIETEFKMEEEI